jgi:hypothetical protein
MKLILLAFAVSFALAFAHLHGSALREPELCIGAQYAIVMQTAAKLQERQLPAGEWCQRPAARLPRQAHPCNCHKADCKDPDPDHLPAHVDSACLSYCHIGDCRCVTQDCP